MNINEVKIDFLILCTKVLDTIKDLKHEVSFAKKASPCLKNAALTVLPLLPDCFEKLTNAHLLTTFVAGAVAKLLDRF